MTIEGTDEVLRYAEGIPITPEEAAEPAVQLAAAPHRSHPFRRLLRRPSVVIALVYLVLLSIAALFAPLLAPHDPNDIDIPERFATPSWSHPLGNDDLGRDLLSRILYGARVSLLVGISVIAIAVVMGLLVGLTSGYLRGRVDGVLMRITDGGLSFPPLVLAIAVAGILGPGTRNVIIALSIVFSFGFIRLVRGSTLTVREEPFIEASRAAGSRTRRILSHRVLPNVRSPLIVAATFGIAAALLAETILAYLGLGPPSPNASWGGMLSEAYTRALYPASWQLLIPGVTIAITVYAFTTVGDGLRDVLGIGRSKRARRTERRGLTVVARTSTDPRPSSVVPATPASAPASAPLLEIDGLSVEFDTERGASRVVERVSLSIQPGETVGVVGESGSGKTVTALSITRLLPSPPGRIVDGSIRFDGRELLDLSFADMRALRGAEIGMIFQDPMTSLDPAFTVGSLLVEAQRLHRSVSRNAARSRALELLELVGIPAPEARIRQYPHQLSGGLRQRVMIALALANEPKLLIADEPTTALDVTVQAQILELLKRLQRELGMAILFVTHDLGVIADVCDRVAVMYAGQIVEEATVDELFAHPRHPYTEGLLGAMPQVGRLDARLTVIRGQVPLPHEMPIGCRFADRCDYVVDACRAAPVPIAVHGPALVRCARVAELSLRGAE